ncbi:ribonuclease P protein component [Corynebacterium flavescens]|uniref:ribonuclease P protein component n=1 Tax=Corynebacterium flavescens TaxID=28028 RepID=UPI00264725B9|nr:ribonuclease P protein component [Corynebacterium flavescens]MDN6200265.1 ribonuclease P protein component [Corynebacterium flavescens]MDN6226864.1 ribonuclease P protein component [Corynebacterium flavescens]MDN6646556.1 ribonuclease P protein component [Corynebacterium flavescens]
MLPSQHKLTSPTQFRRVIKGGSRAGTRTLVVHMQERQRSTEDIAASGPRFGLVVSKAVGNAVVRHRTSRRLRHVCMALAGLLPAHADIVIRALPASAEASSAKLAADLLKAVRKKWDI